MKFSENVEISSIHSFLVQQPSMFDKLQNLYLFQVKFPKLRYNIISGIVFSSTSYFKVSEKKTHFFMYIYYFLNIVFNIVYVSSKLLLITYFFYLISFANML